MNENYNEMEDIDQTAPDSKDDFYDFFMKQIAKYPKFNNEKNIEMFQKLKEAVGEEKNDIESEIFNGNISLVVSEAKKIAFDFAPANSSRINSSLIMDFYQEGSNGLFNAIKNFDSSKGFAFSTFAVKCIRSAIFAYLNNDFHMIHIPEKLNNKARQYRSVIKDLTKELQRTPTSEEVAKKLNDGTTPDEIDRVMSIYASSFVNTLDNKKDDQEEDVSKISYNQIPSTELNPQEYSEQNEMLAKLKDALQSLTPQMRFIIEKRHPMDDSKEWTLKELSEQLNISMERVRQIENEALKILKQKLS